MMVSVRVLLFFWYAAEIGCTPPPVAPVAHAEISGAGLLLDLSPTNRPSLVGNLDFDLLPSGAGTACVARDSHKQYWVGVTELAKIASDPLTRQAIAAAVTDAVSRFEDTDAVLLTSVVTESHGPNQVCATVVGRGFRLTKGAPTALASHPATP